MVRMSHPELLVPTLSWVKVFSGGLFILVSWQTFGFLRKPFPLSFSMHTFGPSQRAFTALYAIDLSPGERLRTRKCLPSERVHTSVRGFTQAKAERVRTNTLEGSHKVRGFTQGSVFLFCLNINMLACFSLPFLIFHVDSYV